MVIDNLTSNETCYNYVHLVVIDFSVNHHQCIDNLVEDLCNFLLKTSWSFPHCYLEWIPITFCNSSIQSVDCVYGVALYTSSSMVHFLKKVTIVGGKKDTHSFWNTCLYIKASMKKTNQTQKLAKMGLSSNKFPDNYLKITS